MIQLLERKIYSLKCLIPNLEYEINIYPLVYDSKIKDFVYDAKYDSMVKTLAEYKALIKMHQYNLEVYTKFLNNLK
jgi:hypothetical protein